MSSESEMDEFCMTHSSILKLNLMFVSENCGKAQLIAGYASYMLISERRYDLPGAPEVDNQSPSPPVLFSFRSPGQAGVHGH